MLFSPVPFPLSSVLVVLVLLGHITTLVLGNFCVPVFLVHLSSLLCLCILRCVLFLLLTLLVLIALFWDMGVCFFLFCFLMLSISCLLLLVLCVFVPLASIFHSVLWVHGLFCRKSKSWIYHSFLVFYCFLFCYMYVFVWQTGQWKCCPVSSHFLNPLRWACTVLLHPSQRYSHMSFSLFMHFAFLWCKSSYIVWVIFMYALIIMFILLPHYLVFFRILSSVCFLLRFSFV